MPFAFNKQHEVVGEAKELLEVCKDEHNDERIKLPQPIESNSNKNWKNCGLLPDLCSFAGRQFVYRNSCL